MEERSRKAPFLHGHKGNRWKYCRNFAGKANEKEADRKSLVASPIAWRHDLPALQAAYGYCRFFHLSGPVMEKGKIPGFLWQAGMALQRIAGRPACLNVPSDRGSGQGRTGLTLLGHFGFR